MLFVKSDAIGFVRVESRVCTGDKGATYGDLGGESDDRGGDVGGSKCGYGGVNIAGVGGQ